MFYRRLPRARVRRRLGFRPAQLGALVFYIKAASRSPSAFFSSSPSSLPFLPLDPIDVARLSATMSNLPHEPEFEQAYNGTFHVHACLSATTAETRRHAC